MFFFFNDTATTEIYTLSLHDALPISAGRRGRLNEDPLPPPLAGSRRAPEGAGSARGAAGHDEHRPVRAVQQRDRKSTRLNSSHAKNSYAVFCFKKKNNKLQCRLSQYL